MSDEAYLRLVGDQQFENRGHFFAAAAEAMRRILVDRAGEGSAVVAGVAAGRNVYDALTRAERDLPHPKRSDQREDLPTDVAQPDDAEGSGGDAHAHVIELLGPAARAR